jgi:hypothetical protein
MTVLLAFRNGNGPARVSAVPATLSGKGVVVGNAVELVPLAPKPAHALTAAEAINAARPFARKFTGAPPAALEASISVRDRPITAVPAWVITFTAPKPFPANGVVVSHYSVALQAVTGKYLLGFLTP